MNVKPLLSWDFMLRESLNYAYRFSFRYDITHPFPFNLKWNEVSVNALTYNMIYSSSRVESIFLMIVALNVLPDKFPLDFQWTFGAIISEYRLSFLTWLILYQAPVTPYIAKCIRARNLTTLHLKWCYFCEPIHEWTDFDSLKVLQVDLHMKLEFTPPKRLERLIVHCQSGSNPLDPAYRCEIKASECEVLREV